MQVFVPYPSPLDVAKCLDRKRLLKQITECKQILAAISGESRGWKGHPVTKMYARHESWLRWYMASLYFFNAGNEPEALFNSHFADIFRPPFLTEAFCDQHKRRLYTKAPNLYPQFASYGKSEENWYVVDGMVLRYENGKQVGAVPESFLKTCFPLKDIRAYGEKLKQFKVEK